jgi:exodeoxyribonuclease VII large subunit
MILTGSYTQFMPSLEENLDIFATHERSILTVSQFTGNVRQLLEEEFSGLWVSGEISNLAKPSSGHLYWTLKDDRAQVRCAMFRQNNRRLDFAPENGTQVVLRGRVSLYEARGDFQIIVEHMEEAGEGILKRQFEALKRKLNEEGLFDAQIKQPLPRLPQRIGVISSPTGAALRDILSVLKRRFPAIPVLIYPTKVQGETAAKEIAATVNLANQRQDCDVLILARGGGSLEDLWAFNEEVLARAIHGGSIPLIAGVGHEVDVTIADFVADVRAPTPTAAAELVVPDQQEWLSRIQELRRRLDRAAGQNLDQLGQRVGQLKHRLERCHPGRRLSELAQRLDQAELSLTRSLSHVLTRAQERLRLLQRALAGQHPGQRLQTMGLRIAELERRLGRAMATHLEKYQQRLGLAVRGLNTVSPLATLERGYAIVTDGDNLIQTTDQLEVNQAVEVRLTQGSFEADVKRLKRPD